tara:strand:+ start:1463 stop:1723 length:261 start_codon:yes stop_codon:yes gene_type:complete
MAVNTNTNEREIMKPQKYQIWMRTWDTMEYVSPLYLTATSFEDAYNKMLIFRDQYQVKSCLPESEHITDNGVVRALTKMEEAWMNY